MHIKPVFIVNSSSPFLLICLMAGSLAEISWFFINTQISIIYVSFGGIFQNLISLDYLFKLFSKLFIILNNIGMNWLYDFSERSFNLLQTSSLANPKDLIVALRESPEVLNFNASVKHIKIINKILYNEELAKDGIRLWH